MKTLMLSLSASVLLAGAMVSFTSAPAVAVYDYPWCARSSAGQGGGPSCRYSTYEQCYASTVQSNGWCEKNSRVVWQEQQAKRGVR
jgi:hypothetical protein